MRKTTISLEIDATIAAEYKVDELFRRVCDSVVADLVDGLRLYHQLQTSDIKENGGGDQGNMSQPER